MKWILILAILGLSRMLKLINEQKAAEDQTEFAFMDLLKPKSV